MSVRIIEWRKARGFALLAERKDFNRRKLLRQLWVRRIGYFVECVPAMLLIGLPWLLTLALHNPFARLLKWWDKRERGYQNLADALAYYRGKYVETDDDEPERLEG